MAPGVYPTCAPKEPICQKKQVNTSSVLAAFDEDLTVAFRGPLNLTRFAVYQPSGSSWSRVSRYDQFSKTSENLVFLNNKGDDKISGTWSICHGNSQSFASADGLLPVKTSTVFNGWLANNAGINVMTSKACTSSTCNGFYRGVAYQGWGGASKAFVVEVAMPHATGSPQGSNHDMPAVWILNGQIVRTSQYSNRDCNCRGKGANGGCGELDIAEVIRGDLTRCNNHMYTYYGSSGGGNKYQFDRPLTLATFVVITQPDKSSVHIKRLSSSFSFGSQLDANTLAKWMEKSSNVVDMNKAAL